ncbi:hypothetical protein BDU57DRAFT_2142 [Ampelomyces quisqualis]|uniref:Uncharacterized protein n=1 Tax=Ampelomyces quisqualis TaxID=50730 RepID=A0A6A5QXA8_AMPQU|nr:hypothetical protein BDU57DRAFT_2142 [Ampelomyces quisqualis]
MSTCISSRVLAKDFEPKRNLVPVGPAELKKTRGLMSYFYLEDTIAKYYGPHKKGDRWVRRHAVFNKLHQVSKHQLKDQQLADERKGTKHHNAMLFEWMSNKTAPQSSKNSLKKNPRIRVLEYNKVDDEYATLFRTMFSELHSNFDYLAFFLQANETVIRVCNEVLHDNALQLARCNDIQKAQNPDNFILITELFCALQNKPKDIKTKLKGGELSTEMVPLDQVKRIAGIIHKSFLRRAA